MILYNLIVINKSRKVLLPGVNPKDLKPISSLLHPSNLIIPLLLVSLLGQISENLKDVLSPKEIQRLPSVKLYSKLLYSGFNSTSLSAVVSLSKTLGPELESLSVLSVFERISFLRTLQKEIIFSKVPAKIYASPQKLYNPNDLMKHRKGLAIQCRSSMVAGALFSTHTITLGIPVSQINLHYIIDSSKTFWLTLGLGSEDFDFLLRKQAFNSLKKFSNLNFVIQTDIDCLKMLVISEILNFMKFDSFLEFDEDMLVINMDNNLVPLEAELGFINRTFPQISKDVFVKTDDLNDDLLRAALDQRKLYKLHMDNILKRSYISNSLKNKDNHNVQSIKLKKFLTHNQ